MMQIGRSQKYGDLDNILRLNQGFQQITLLIHVEQNQQSYKKGLRKVFTQWILNKPYILGRR